MHKLIIKLTIDDLEPIVNYSIKLALIVVIVTRDVLSDELYDTTSIVKYNVFYLFISSLNYEMENRDVLTPSKI